MPVPSSKNSKSSCLFQSTSFTALTKALSGCSMFVSPLVSQFPNRIADAGARGAWRKKEPAARRRCPAQAENKKDRRSPPGPALFTLSFYLRDSASPPCTFGPRNELLQSHIHL